MRHSIFILISLIITFELSAQFSKISVNGGNIASRAITKAAGDNDFVSVIDGELYHIVYNGSTSFATNRIENSIISIDDFVMHDIDRDGDKDIICYDSGADNFHVYVKENGAYKYFPAWNLYYNNPHYLHSEDFDDDGYEDLMINHEIFINTGVNQRSKILRYPLSNTYYYDYAHFYDYDSDGDRDILLLQIHRLWILVNTGNDITNTKVNISETNNKTEWSSVIKTTQGEKVFYHDRSAKKIKEIVFSDGNYTIRNVVDLPINGSQEEVVVYDLDKDGNEEIIINAFNYREIIVFKYDPESETGQTITIDLGSNLAYAFGVLEIEGEPMIFTGGPNNYSVYKINDDLVPELYFSSIAAIEGNQNGFKDFDGDGYTDIINGNRIKRYLGDAQFGGIDLIDYPSTGGTLIDYDGDGDLDYVKAEEWYENTGNFTFGPSQEIIDTDPTPDPNIFFTNELIREDIDKDGDIDILTYNNFGEPLELLENINNDYFEDPVTLATSANIGGDLVHISIRDMDGDDINDILMAAVTGMILIKGKGDLDFDEAISLYEGDNKVLSADVDDINDDEYPDIILGSRNIIAGNAIGEAILYMGNNDIPSSTTISAGDGYHRVAFANIDSSGWLDVVYQNEGGIYWSNINEDITFQTDNIDNALEINDKILVDDVNSDGKDDIILYRDNDTNIYYYLNGGEVTMSDICPEGDVYLRDQSQVDEYGEKHGQCTEIEGDLFIGRAENDWSDITDISAFKEIREIKGDLHFHLNNLLSDFNGLSNLEKIEGSYIVNGHKSTSFGGMEKLRYIGGDFDFNNVSTIGSFSADLSEFISLDTIVGNVYIHRSNVSSIATIIQKTFNGDLSLSEAFTFFDTDSFDQIDTIKGTLYIQVTQVESLEKLKDIKEIGGLFIKDNDNLTKFDVANSVKHIEKNVVISGNDILTLEGGLDSLETTGGSIALESRFTHCKMFKKIKKIGGGLSLLVKTMDDGSFANLDSIGSGLSMLIYEGQDLRQFSNLKVINGFLNITNNEISSLYGLHNITEVKNGLDINSNDNLRNLEELNDSLVVEGQWRMLSNDILDYCNVFPVCNHIAKGGQINISNNGIDCSDISQVRCTDNTFSGFVYHDFNKNSLKDVFEAVLPNIKIVFNSQQDTFITSGNGYYLTSVSVGDSLKVEATIPADWESTADNIIKIDSFIAGDPSNYGNNFGLIPQFDRHEMSMTYNQGLFLCDRPYELSIDIFNKGTYAESGFLEINYPDYVALDQNFTDYSSHDSVNNILRIEYDTIYPFFSENIKIPFVAPSADHINEVFMTTIDLNRNVGGSTELVAYEELENILLCSYDPNDKLVRSSNGTKDIEVNSDDELIYTVRFQNTGNYFAENVRIIDTLSENLDIYSFEFISSSHPVEIRKEENIFYFNFYGINLPDSLSDFTGSQGYVSFMIKPTSTMELGLKITNEADIYFDYNDPILTNLVLSEVVNLSAVHHETSHLEIELYPNPASDVIAVRGIPDIDRLNYRVYDVTGNLVFTGDMTTQQIDISMLNPGVYFLHIFSDDISLGVYRIVIMD